jgi:hypothetical protein
MAVPDSSIPFPHQNGLEVALKLNTRDQKVIREFIKASGKVVKGRNGIRKLWDRAPGRPDMQLNDTDIDNVARTFPAAQSTGQVAQGIANVSGLLGTLSTGSALVVVASLPDSPQQDIAEGLSWTGLALRGITHAADYFRLKSGVRLEGAYRVHSANLQEEQDWGREAFEVLRPHMDDPTQFTALATEVDAAIIGLERGQKQLDF